MSFEWNRIHKWEDNIEREVTDGVFEYVCEYYEVDDVNDLTKDQLLDIIVFREELNEYSPMQIGFSNLINHMEDMFLEDEDD
jgi:hypothetical protein